MSWRSTWSAPKAKLEEIERILTEIAIPSVDATSLHRNDDGSAEPDQASWSLHAYTQEPITSAVLALLEDAYRSPIAEELPDIDWVAHALEGLGVIEAGPFILFGSHDAAEAAKSPNIPLQIEANQAFGTGHHPTTAGCLEALAKLSDTPASILDIGTGSGVLAIAARRLFSNAMIIATDIDEKSVEIADENAAINGVTDIQFTAAAGTDGPLIQNNKPFDRVFANILAGPLKELSSDIYAVTAPEGSIILAGLLDEQCESVIEAYNAQGFSLQDQGGTSRWPVLTMKKSGGYQ